MKKTTLLLLMAAFCMSSFGQLNDSTYRQTVKNDFLRKSRNQRTTGFILLGAGVVLTVTGVAMVNNGNDDILNPGNWVDTGAGAGIATVGILSTLTSIPFFIMSINNNKKAKKMSAGVSFEKIMHSEINTAYPNYYPALSARINF
ncbi:MAG TPA: hypothetical protein VLA58_08960 [Chitinophagaceae bacterium]|nr:hypothetical protein [Chitinophagaceae bacterium]